MLAPINVKVFYPLFSDVAIDAVDYLKSLRDENSIINDVREAVLGKWALECKYLFKLCTNLHHIYESSTLLVLICTMLCFFI